MFTAFAYAELVTKYPQAAGAALYVNKAFRMPFLTFMVAFAVMASGITSAATLSRAFGGDYLKEFVSIPTVLAALVFIVVVAAINFRGISESVKLNVALTTIEVLGLLLIIVIALAALADGEGDAGRAFEFKEGEGVIGAMVGGAALAFYALIGFEDSVNVAEETEQPAARLPARAVRRAADRRASSTSPSRRWPPWSCRPTRWPSPSGPLLEVVQVGPLSVSTKLFAAIALFAVANGALINMIMASRLIYGMSRQGIVPRIFGAVHARRRTPLAAIVFTTALAMILITTGDLSDLADTTVLLLLVVFIFVNVSVLVLRRDRVDHAHFHAPTAFPVIGVGVCIALMTEKTGETYLRAGDPAGRRRRLLGGQPPDQRAAAPDGHPAAARPVARPDAPPPSS